MGLLSSEDSTGGGRTDIQDDLHDFAKTQVPCWLLAGLAGGLGCSPFEPLPGAL